MTDDLIKLLDYTIMKLKDDLMKDRDLEEYCKEYRNMLKTAQLLRFKSGSTQ